MTHGPPRAAGARRSSPCGSARPTSRRGARAGPPGDGLRRWRGGVRGGDGAVRLRQVDPAEPRRRPRRRRPRARSSSPASLTGRGRDDLARMRRRHIGIVFQFFNLLEGMTVLENVALPRWSPAPSASRPRPGPRPARPARPGRQGARPRRACCPAASASAWPSPGHWPTSPTVLLADEPTGALDSEGGAEVSSCSAAPRRRPDHPAGHPRPGRGRGRRTDRPHGGRPRGRRGDRPAGAGPPVGPAPPFRHPSGAGRSRGGAAVLSRAPGRTASPARATAAAGAAGRPGWRGGVGRGRRARSGPTSAWTGSWPTTGRRERHRGRGSTSTVVGACRRCRRRRGRLREFNAQHASGGPDDGGARHVALLGHVRGQLASPRTGRCWSGGRRRDPPAA